MKFKPQNVTGHIPEGSYQGVITEQSVSPDEKYVWLKIEIEGMEDLLNVSVPVNSVIFNSFAKDFADEKGEVDTEDFVDVEIEFSLIDRTINGCIYSKFSLIKAIMEEEQND